MATYTDLARVKRRLFDQSSPTSQYDTILGELIDEVSGDVETRIGRALDEATITEYVDGTGSDILPLRGGPLVSVTSVDWVSYDSAGDETTTTLDVGTYVPRGLRDDGWLRNAWLGTRGSWTWSSGERNVKVVYVAGFASIPDRLILGVTNHVVRLFQLRDKIGVQSVSIGDGTTSILSPAQLDALLDRLVEPYRSMRI